MTLAANYMRFRPWRPDDVFYLGGRPTVYPDVYPWEPRDDQYIAFLGQLRVDTGKLQLPNVEWVQLYQGYEEGDDPTPMVVALHPGQGRRRPGSRVLPEHPGVERLGIEFEPREDPERFPEGWSVEEQGALFLSKLGGLDPWGLDSECGRFLGQIHGGACGLNLGGRACGLYERDGEVVPLLR